MASLGVVSYPRRGFLSMPLLVSHVNTACAFLLSESEACAQPCSWLQWSQSKCPAHNFTSTFVTRPFLACHDLQGRVGVQTPKSPRWAHRVRSWLGWALLLLLPGITPTFACVKAVEESRARSPPGVSALGALKVMGDCGVSGWNSVLQGLRLSINDVN